MLNEKIKELRKQKGFTQEELATRLNVVRQTVSKWEKGLSVPDADVLRSIAEQFEVTVEELLGDNAEQTKNQDDIAGQLSKINEQMAMRNRRSLLFWKIISIVLSVLLIFSVAFFVFRQQTTNTLPDVIELSNIQIKGQGHSIACSFVPGVGDEDLQYSVTIHSNSLLSEEQTVNAYYHNGLCTAEFDRTGLLENTEYSIVLNVSSGEETRNTTVVDSFSMENGGYSWSSPWN